jgi:hypothetical protein
MSHYEELRASSWSVIFRPNAGSARLGSTLPAK